MNFAAMRNLTTTMHFLWLVVAWRLVVFLPIAHQVLATVDHINFSSKAVNATDSTTVNALLNIQALYGFNLSWEKDPCIPTPWQRVKCYSNTVISLDLSHMNLSAVIAAAFGDLIDLQTLDLHSNSLMAGVENLEPLVDLQVLNLSFNLLHGSIPNLDGMVNLKKLDLQNNNFTGALPESLGNLPNLQELNVENNKLVGPIPASLNKSSLDLRLSGNPCLGNVCGSPSPPNPHVVEGSPPPTMVMTASPPFFTAPTKQKHKKVSVIYGASISGALALLIICGILLMSLLRRQKRGMQPLSSQSRKYLNASTGAQRFSLEEVKKGTSNLSNPIGLGSFGPVYLGRLADGQRVAVKVRSDTSQIGSESFANEVFLLSQAQHQNLVSLIGFCMEENQHILIYEYLPGGTLMDQLYGNKAKKRPLVWKKRLQIALGAATGLDYLHRHIPKIIHRDVKSNNILLDAELNAKVSDFGLSKHLPDDDATHVTTVVKGTAGYLDPEYYATKQLTDKSDVYSFGVVLLEVICGREPLSQNCRPEQYNLVSWAKPFLETCSIGSIVDKSLESRYSLQSMDAVAQLAARCVDRDPSSRPSMQEVVGELKVALAVEEQQNGMFPSANL